MTKKQLLIDQARSSAIEAIVCVSSLYALPPGDPDDPAIYDRAIAAHRERAAIALDRIKDYLDLNK